MHFDVVRQQLNATPFVPFRIHTSDGRSFRIPSPEWALVTNLSTAIAVPDQPDDKNNMILLSNSQIVSIEPIVGADNRG